MTEFGNITFTTSSISFDSHLESVTAGISLGLLVVRVYHDGRSAQNRHKSFLQHNLITIQPRFLPTIVMIKSEERIYTQCKAIRFKI